jgi:maltose-binding protein MalE
LGSDIAKRFGKEIHNILKNKQGFEKGWKMVSFISIEMPLVKKLVKTPDGMSRLSKYFVEYGDEGGNFLKKMGKIEPRKVWQREKLEEHWNKHKSDDLMKELFDGKEPTIEEYEELSKDVIEKGKKVIYKHKGMYDRIGFFYEKKGKVIFSSVNDKQETVTCFVCGNAPKGWKYVNKEDIFQQAFKVDDFPKVE